ncbi:hypothetical protein, partial [Corynebacterium coyleae]|uniref:hypothetical protein n=1 Tax=Corynebacterium coyleae TaxID=53374 RepID=UPI001ADD17C1
CSEYFDTLKVDGANHGSKVRYRILTQALPDTHHTATIFFFLTSTVKAHRDDLFEVGHKDRLLPSRS